MNTTDPATAAPSTPEQATQTPSTTELTHTERKLVGRLQYSIDENAQYAGKLRDLSLGYAAASGGTEKEAQEKIGGMFKQQTGSTLQEHLEQERTSRGLANEPLARGR